MFGIVFVSGVFFMIPALLAGEDVLVGLTVFGGFAIVFVGLGAGMCWVRHRHRNDHVVLLENGLVSYCGHRTDSCRWTEVEAIYRGEINRGDASSYVTVPFLKLQMPAGRAFTVGGANVHLWGGEIESIQELCKQVELNVYQHLLPKAMGEFSEDRILDFDAFRVSREGIEIGGRLVPWSDIGGLSFDRFFMQGACATRLSIMKKNGTSRWKTSPSLYCIRNVRLLQLLVDTRCNLHQ